PDIFPFIDSAVQADPNEAIIGQVITLTGTGLLGTQKVVFQAAAGGTIDADEFTVASDNVLTVRVPQGAASGPITGVSVDARTGTNPLQDSTVGFPLLPSPAPAVTSFFSASGPIGTPVVVTGQHFTGAQTVVVGGITLSVDKFQVLSDEQIQLTVPAG